MTTDPDEPQEPGELPGAPAEEAAPAAPRRRLTRSRGDQMIGGVAGGIANYFDLDPVLVRVAFVVLALVSGGGAILGYIVAWIVMPEEGGSAAWAAAGPGIGGGATAAMRRGSGGAAAGIMWGLILIAVGGFALLTRLDVRIPGWSTVLAGVLILVGALIVVESRKGLNGGLVTLAVGLSVVLGAAAMVDFRFESGFGDRRVEVTRAGDLESSYGHAFGSMTVDLSNMALPEGLTRLSVSVAFGDVVVRLPEDVPYRLNATAAFGSVDAPSFDADGIAVNRSYRSPGYDDASRRIEIDVSAAFGSARVR